MLRLRPEYSQISAFKRQPHKLVKLTKTFCQLFLTSSLSVFNYFVEFALKRLTTYMVILCTKNETVH